jgi:hypothetical protein
MSAQQGTAVGRRVLHVPTLPIIAASVGVFALLAVAVLVQRSTNEFRPILNTADLATSGVAIRERHEALGGLGAVFTVNPADLATSGVAIRERHEALGGLDGASFTGES